MLPHNKNIHDHFSRKFTQFLVLKKKDISFISHLYTSVELPVSYIIYMLFLSLLQMYACILIFFTTNMIEGQLISTGAFEVSLNGKIQRQLMDA